MIDVLRSLTPEALEALAGALEGNRLAPPYEPLALRSLIAGAHRATLGEALTGLDGTGFGPHQIAVLARALAGEKREHRAAPTLELVWSGPEVAGSASRDTSVVAEELFRTAREQILIAGFAVYQGRRVFAALAERMDREPELRVRMFLNVGRPYGDTSPDEQLVDAFRRRFEREEWPGKRRPEVFYDPRSLEGGRGPRMALHAKCIIADEDAALITSANFTEAAQERNIEAGLLFRDAPVVRALKRQFESLLDLGWFRSLPRGF